MSTLHIVQHVNRQVPPSRRSPHLSSDHTYLCHHDPPGRHKTSPLPRRPPDREKSMFTCTNVTSVYRDVTTQVLLLGDNPNDSPTRVRTLSHRPDISTHRQKVPYFGDFVVENTVPIRVHPKDPISRDITLNSTHSNCRSTNCRRLDVQSEKPSHFTPTLWSFQVSDPTATVINRIRDL